MYWTTSGESVLPLAGDEQGELSMLRDEGAHGPAKGQGCHPAGVGVRQDVVDEHVGQQCLLELALHGGMRHPHVGTVHAVLHENGQFARVDDLVLELFAVVRDGDGRALRYLGRESGA